MVNALKRMDKKFLIFAGLIICLPLVLIIFLALIQSCGNQKDSYEGYESKMLSAAERYISDTKKTPKEEGESLTIKLSTLVNKGYLKSSEKLLNDSTCKGTVTVRRNGASIETTAGGFLNYIVDLNCKEYETVHLVDKIKESVVSEGPGLYEVDGTYVFKGDKVNNYIVFFGQNYRIMSISEDGILKLVKTEPEATNRIWDNKFNVETNSNSGKNIYKDSVILKILIADYENTTKISTKAKKHVVAQDVCIGKRSITDISLDSQVDCSEILENQIISLLNVSDYTRVSLDPDCDSLTARSCNNYNYLYGVASSTWTLNGVAENTYEVLFLADGRMISQTANTYAEYNLVIYIDGNELYTNGKGSANSPYVIE